MAYHFSCVDLTISVRYVGVIGLIISAIMINLLTQDLLNQDSSTTVIEAILGLEWRDFVPFEDRNQQQGQLLPTILFFYSFFYMVSCLLLIFSSLFYKRYLTIPWFICETASLSSQICALVIHTLHEYSLYRTHLIVSTSFYIVISTYCWIIVFLAQRKWGYSLNVSLELNNNTAINYEMNVANISVWDSPQAYRMNVNYNVI